MKKLMEAEDLNELNEKQINTLKEWWKPQEGDAIYFNHACLFVTYVGENTLITPLVHVETCDVMPLLNIGQMIELILSKSKSKLLHALNLYIKRRVLHSFKRKEETELYDILWSTVKRIL